MIKSCTITFHGAINYGAFLQAYALQCFLGTSNVILNYNPKKKTDWHSFVSKKKRGQLPVFWRLLALWRRLQYKRCYFKEYDMLRLSQEFHSCKSVFKNLPQADFYIVGSDQIWNSELLSTYSYPWEIYFLTFENENIKRIAYSASLGGNEWTADFTTKVLPHLKKMDAISVRENSSVPFLTSIGLKNIMVTCDPTILHTADFYRSRFPYSKDGCQNHTLLFSLAMEIPVNIQEILNGKKILSHKFTKQEPLVAKWLHCIDTADAVITDSFHCTIFSILFHKNFVVFPHAMKNRSERLTMLLGKVNLGYRFLAGEETKEQIEEIMCRPVDWLQIDKILEDWRIESGNWLNNALIL